jgi:hypothetical protein
MNASQLCNPPGHWMDSPFSARFRLADRGDIPAAPVARGIAQLRTRQQVCP